MHSAIKVLVVDDSALIRQMLTRALSLDPSIEVVGIARDGVEAIQKTIELQPDVVTLDVTMPELGGIEAIPFILKRSSARIVMLSSLDDPDMTYQALSAGAVDFIVKPREGVATSLTQLTNLLLKKIKTANRIKPGEPQLSGDMPLVTEIDTFGGATQKTSAERLSIVAIAASTGGPPTLERLFSRLDSSLPAAYVIVQHLPSGFGDSFARRLSKASDIPVVQAAAGMFLEPGVAYLAPHGVHTQIEGHLRPRTSMADGPLLHGVRPSADPLFISLADSFAEQSIGIVLTGMGSDGAVGLLRMREAGSLTFAQDEASSVVFGMPHAAQVIGAAQRVLDPSHIAAELRVALGGGSHYER